MSDYVSSLHRTAAGEIVFEERYLPGAGHAWSRTFCVDQYEGIKRYLGLPMSAKLAWQCDEESASDNMEHVSPREGAVSIPLGDCRMTISVGPTSVSAKPAQPARWWSRVRMWWKR